MSKIKQITLVSDSNINDDAYQLVKDLFDIDAVFISNESILEDFINSEKHTSLPKIREVLFEEVALVYGVFLREVLDGETRIWKVVELIKEQQLLLRSNKKISKMLTS